MPSYLVETFLARGAAGERRAPGRPGAIAGRGGDLVARFGRLTNKGDDMRKLRTLSLAMGLLLAAPAAALAANPVDDGCPASTDLISVEYLESVGPYGLPRQLDEGGNGDGWVCAFPLPDAMAAAMGAPFTIYQFFENNLPAAH